MRRRRSRGRLRSEACVPSHTAEVVRPVHEGVGAPAAAEGAVRDAVAGRQALVLPQEAAVREERLDWQVLIHVDERRMEMPAACVKQHRSHHACRRGRAALSARSVFRRNVLRVCLAALTRHGMWIDA